MGLLKQIGKMIPHASAQGAADSFLSGVGGGLAGGGLGAAFGGENSMVPGAFAGAGVGMGAHAIVPLLIKSIRRMMPQASEQQVMQMISEMPQEQITALLKKGDF